MNPDATRVVRELIWTRRGTAGRAAWLALLPMSWFFGAAVALRNAAYDAGVLKRERAGTRVVSVGNLTVGGTGKTPLALWLARALAADGTRVALVLRGYGGDANGVTVVSQGGRAQASVAAAGDEAVMLAKCFDGVVLTARHRIDAVRQAERLGCAVVVLDDGFQHRSLERDFDLVVVDGQGGSLLPAGPFRECYSAVARADAVALVAKQNGAAASAAEELPAGKPVFTVRFAPVALVESDAGVWYEKPLGSLSGVRIIVVAGIAQPGPFYATLREWEADIVEVFEYPDHHRYTAHDWQTINRRAHEVDAIVTTEKDLVKLEHFPFARGKLLALRIAPIIDDGDELVRQVRARSVHGQVETKGARAAN
jgi:tetraacyldisaccharide 4'-kinase